MKTFTWRKHLLLLCLLGVCLFLNFSAEAQTERIISTKASSAANFPQASDAIYEYRIIPSTEGSFGYEIFQNKNLFIRQLTIPGMSGKKGFKTKGDAEKVASLILKKLKSGEMPPTINPEELKNLDIK